MSPKRKPPKTIKNLSLLQILMNLLKSYSHNEKLTPFEFIESKQKSNDVTEQVGSMFIKMYRHKLLLENIAQSYHEYLISSKIINKHDRQFNGEETMVILYLIIFETTSETSQDISRNFEKNSSAFGNIISFLSVEDNLIKIIEDGCKMYDKEYLLENILCRLVQNESIIKTMEETIAKKEKANSSKRGLTTPKGPSMLQKAKKTLIQEESTPIKRFEATPIPKTMYVAENKEQKTLEEARLKNHQAAYALLAQARKFKFRCAEVKPTPKPPTPPSLYQPVIAKPPPKFEPVEVKGTTTSLMRHAALLTKEKEAEIREIERLVSGAMADPCDSKFLEEIRLAKEEEALQDIERKHLQGLLTREEAILAKQRLFQRNQAKKQQYQEERIKLLETIDQYRRQEEEKTKLLVEKAQAIAKGAKDAEAKLLKERRCNAKLVGYETQILLKQAYDEREEELNKKMQLIKELKLLQQINARSNKVEFDPTETCNLGLLCEMSIAELQERLALLKVTMHEEIEERKAKILAEKKKQQTMLEQMKEFVETAKGVKCRPSVSKELKKENSLINKPVPIDIQILREKLKTAREQRVNGTSSTSVL